MCTQLAFMHVRSSLRSQVKQTSLLRVVIMALVPTSAKACNQKAHLCEAMETAPCKRRQALHDVWQGARSAGFGAARPRGPS
mmetsp:Transcript_94653/g.305592  ORF Transcript_94653/g.305592 Transcript_94653/m.305592 type:complete len:82 (-) Transcript_94653:721-966(-)